MKAQSKLTVLTRPWHANFTETNHLGSAFLAEPHKFDKVLTRVFTASRLADNPLTAMTKVWVELQKSNHSIGNGN